MVLWTILLQIFALLIIGYFYLNHKFNYWSSRGVNGPRPWTPFGTFWDLAREGQVKLEKEWVRKYGKVYGIYQATTPVLTIVDHELIKQVMVKDFPAFVNRNRGFLDHEIWSINLFSSSDEEWRRLRSITSPSFTTGKLRAMHSLMHRCIDKLSDYFDIIIETQNGEMNAKKVIVGFTIDVIASTFFGTETNANDSRERKSDFVHYRSKFFDLSPVKIASSFLFPRWFNNLIDNEIIFPMDSFNFFVQLSREILKQRKLEQVNGRSKVKRNDLVQLMMDAFVYEDELKGEVNYDKLTVDGDNDASEDQEKKFSSSTKKTLTENEIIAQCILFFTAGFDTTANTISNCLYHLAIYPEIQEILHDKVTQAVEGLQVDTEEYNVVVNTKIPYLEALIKETLRIAPPVTRLQRQVDADGFKLGGVVLEKGGLIEIAAYGVHHCPDYYPEPEQFKPSRFMPENKHLLVPYTYLPFGAGPRNCMGLRFVYQEIKLCLAKIVPKNRFEPTAQTKIPLDYNNLDFLSTKNIPLRVCKR